MPQLYPLAAPSVVVPLVEAPALVVGITALEAKLIPEPRYEPNDPNDP